MMHDIKGEPRSCIICFADERGYIMHQRCMTLYKKAMRIHIAFLFMDHKIDALLICSDPADAATTYTYLSDSTCHVFHVLFWFLSEQLFSDSFKLSGTDWAINYKICLADERGCIMHQ